MRNSMKRMLLMVAFAVMVVSLAAPAAMAHASSPDRDSNGVSDEIGINPDSLQPGYPDGEWPDSNGNGTPSEYGDGPDLDGNEVPDEIGINPDSLQPGYSGKLPDGNGIPGEYGDGPDLDGNGVPDEIGINPDMLLRQSGGNTISNEDLGGKLEPLGGFDKAADDAAHDHYWGSQGEPDHSDGNYDKAYDKAAQGDYEGALEEAAREYLGEEYAKFIFDGPLTQQQAKDFWLKTVPKDAQDALSDATGVDFDKWEGIYERIRNKEMINGDGSYLDETVDELLKEAEKELDEDRDYQAAKDASDGNYGDALEKVVGEHSGEGYGEAIDLLGRGEYYHGDALKEAVDERFGEGYGDPVKDLAKDLNDGSALSDAAAKAAGDHFTNTTGIGGFGEAISDVFSGDIKEDFGEDLGQLASNAIGTGLGGPLGAIAGDFARNWIEDNFHWEDVEDAAEDVGDAAKDVGEALGDAAEDVGDAIGGAVDDAGEFLGDLF